MMMTRTMIRMLTYADKDEGCDNDDADSLRKTDEHDDEDKDDDKGC